MMLYTLQNTLHKGLIAKVYLGGERLKRVVEADTDLGYAIRYVVDDRGLIVVENGVAKTEKIFGDISVCIS